MSKAAATYRTLAEPFEEQVDRTPDAVALVGEDGRMTYRQLNESANRLAHALRERGVCAGVFVAVYMERSFDMTIALYAISKAGAAYVPLDPELPSERLQSILHDTKSRLVVTHDRVTPALAAGDWEVLSANDPDLSARPCGNVAIEASPKHPAILLSTSGSTGRPKIVVLPAEQPLAFLLWMRDAYPMRPGDAVVLKTPYGFDVSTYEFFWTLYKGATLVVARPGGHRDPAYLSSLVEAHNVTAIIFIPSMLWAFLEEIDSARCRQLRWVFCGGEVLSAGLRDAFYRRSDAQLVNLYGPTEAGAVTACAVHSEDRSPTVPIGWPTADYRLYVLDGSLEHVPAGETGELYIAGEVGLAHGYHDLPEQTAERFLPDPLGPPGARMYRSGDLSRLTSDRGFEFLGRADREVKIRGQRVSCDEIETVIAGVSGVREAAVIARDHDGETRLAAYLVADPGVTELTVRSELSARLTTAMIPSWFVFMSEWPLSINGKLDRKLLPDPFAPAEELAIPGASELELAVAKLWTGVVGRAPKSIHDEFFASGGDSLRALRLIAQLSELTGLRLALADFVEARTVRALASVLERMHSEVQDV